VSLSQQTQRKLAKLPLAARVHALEMLFVFDLAARVRMHVNSERCYEIAERRLLQMARFAAQVGTTSGAAADPAVPYPSRTVRKARRTAAPARARRVRSRAKAARQ